MDGRAVGRGAQQQHGDDGKDSGLHGSWCLLELGGGVCWFAVGRERERRARSTFIPWSVAFKGGKKGRLMTQQQKKKKIARGHLQLPLLVSGRSCCVSLSGDQN